MLNGAMDERGRVLPGTLDLSPTILYDDGGVLDGVWQRGGIVVEGSGRHFSPTSFRVRRSRFPCFPW